MPIEHRLTQFDTLHSLAQNYLGEAGRWQEIADYNRLGAPYLVATREEADARFASGYVTVTRSNTARAVHVPKGWALRTKPYIIGGLVKEYRTTEAVTVPAGVGVFHLHVRCTEPGVYGNVAEGLVIVPGAEFERAGITVTSVTNATAFKGGLDARVLAPGDTLYIPSEGIYQVVPESREDQLELLGGEDFLLEAEDDGFGMHIPEDRGGDLRSVSGLDNIIQAVNARLLTEKGELPLHPEYGTNLPDILGTSRTGFTKKRVELEIYDALTYEDRIEDVQVTSIREEGTAYRVTIQFRPAFATQPTSIDVALNFSNRG